ncbi:hypothetical protein B0T10DRAFT_589606 [Thelonectria olida]|uniref:Uncharacterized protein n=1 Tax=Thelonectria olida TaxID=1576542 RepID=A0A9P8WAV4_9HYPO|nr:hypothetical protein B0T10DRAFT_589606 [Thelonectria olida]
MERALRNSPRYLTLQHAYRKKLENQAATNSLDTVSDVASKLKPLVKGQAMLYSYFSPSLAGGSYEITSQEIAAGKQELPEDRAKTTKKFHVAAPQYSLHEGAVHSVYPPSGSEARAETLPHVLFTDQYLPWERVSVDTGDDRSRTPWLALLVFSQEELQLTPDLLTGDKSLFKDTTLASKTIQPSQTFAINIPLSDLPHVSKSFYPTPKPDDGSASGQFIFVKKKLFQLLTAKHDVHGTANADQELGDVSRYQYLAHVRHSKAKGLEATGSVEDLFSVVVSHRLAAFDAQKPTRAIVHLVSIEAWNTVNRKSLSDNSSIDYVMLSTLHSWSYTVLPTNAPSVEESFKHIGGSLDVLRVPTKTLNDSRKNTTRLGQHIQKRLEDGYTMTRFRTQTGEETVAFARGALIPTTPPEKLGDFWTSLSFSGGDLQIFDKEAGMMDVTYSLAWTLGKTLALADTTFTKTLGRLRALTEIFAMDEAKQKELSKHEEWKTRDELIKSLTSPVATLFKLASGELGTPATKSAPERRAASDSSEPIDLSRSNVSVQDNFKAAATANIFHFAASDPRGEKFFNELNGPNSTDWMIVLSWVLDRMFLFGVPSQYLIIDPSYLPDESLRFFHVDPHWIDALIDGALSISNHINQADDTLRRILKGAFNAYFATIDPDTGYRPQIPTYGCFLRSGLVKDFPDMHIVAPFVEKTSSMSSEEKKRRERAPVLRQECLAEDTLLCLFDRIPGQQELHTLAFTQPAHQQYFMVGDEITNKKLKTAYKRTYTIGPEGGKYDYKTFPSKEFTRPGKDDPPPSGNCIFLWGEENEARFLNMPGLCQDIRDALQADSGTFNDPIVSAAIVGYQLGSRTYQLKLISDNPPAPSPPPDTSHLSALRAFSAVNSGPRQFRRLNAPMNRQNSAAKSVSSNVATLQAFEPLQMSSLAATINPADGFPRLLNAPPAKNVADRLAAPMSLTALESKGGDADMPKFAYKIYPLGHFKKPLPTKSKLKQDLVFGITLVSGSKDSLQLKSIQFQVPMGPMYNPSDTVNLLESYEGPGPVMLSNLWFNILAKKDEKTLILTLLPRAVSEVVSIDRVRDCSFLLPLVELNHYDKEFKLDVRVIEEYVEYRTREHDVEPKPIMMPVDSV